ncbi:MAG TPA: TonB-dependent receptor plug domain-containing protein [Steroidobacteraceae bacterium]|nr:TonB-dependent receptor plug domain-containing protein [Steroidobacteraceae bacterium]
MDHRRWGIAVAAFVACASAAGASAAADAPAAAEQPAVEEIEAIVVTGSSIPTTPDEVAVPVVRLSAADLELTGVASNVLETLRKAVPAFEGRSNTGNSNANNNNQNTAGGSQLQLRNLPTLVLINGRRVANSGIGAINGKNFVDVNQIPAAAIDHIEVLTDGASSIYGSDAIGGVVNFILKSDYEGLTAGLRDGRATDYGERSAYITGGAKVGKVSIVATASFTHTDPLGQADRPFSNPFLGHAAATTIPGVISGGADELNPALNSPSQKNPTGVNATAGSLATLIGNGTYVPTTAAAISKSFDLAPYQTILLKQNVGSFAASLDAPLIEHVLDAFGDVAISQGKSATHWAPVGTTVTVPVNAPYNPLTTAFPAVTFADLAEPHDFNNTSVSTRVTAGLKGEITRNWNWETAVVYSESDLQQRQAGLIYKPNLALAIAGGYNASGAPVAGGNYAQVLGGYSLSGPMVTQPALDPFATVGGLNPASLANLYGTEVIKAISQLESWDAKLVGRALTLPGGDLGVAVGASLRRESLSGHTDPNGRVTDPVTGSYFGNDQQWIGGTFANPFSKSRTISGEFAEVRVPVTSAAWNVPGFYAFDLTAAVRAEKYSDAGRSTVPKFGFRWQPIDGQFTMRGNYARSFIAPSLYNQYGPTDTRTSNGPIATAFGANYAGEPFNAEDGNNPSLKPATSVSKTIGFVIKPNLVENLVLTADYSYITLSGFQGGAGFNNILTSINTLGSASPFFNSLGVGGFPGAGGTDPFATPGSLLAFLTGPGGKGVPAQAAQLYLVDYFRNLAQLLEESWNITVNYNIPTQNAGTFSFATNGTIFTSFQFNPGIAGLPVVQGAGASNNASVFGGTLPRYRFYSTVDWTYHDLNVSLGNTYSSGVDDRGGSGTLAPIRVSDYSTWDVRGAYDWHGGKVKDLKFALGVNNLTNRMPPLDPRVYIDNNADVSTYSPIGRFVYATVSIGF